MSNFTCPNCGTDIIDSPEGFVTECEHYPKEPVEEITCEDALLQLVEQGQALDMGYGR